MTERPDKVVVAAGLQIFQELRHAACLFAGRQPHDVVHGPPRQILAAALADRIEPLHRQPDRVEPPVTPGARFGLGVQRQQLADRFAVGLGFFGGQGRHLVRRGRNVFSQNLVNDPEAALDGTGPLRLRVRREEYGHPQHAAPAVLLNSVDLLPFALFGTIRPAVVTGERLVDEGRIAVQHVGDGQVILNQVRHQPRRLLEHRLPQFVVECGKDLSVHRLLAQKIAVAQPLAEELQRRRR